VGHNGYYPEKNNIPYGIVQNNKNNKQISVITGGDNGVQKLAVFRRPLSSPATIARYHRPLSSPTIIIAHYHRPLPSPTIIARYHRPLSSTTATTITMPNTRIFVNPSSTVSYCMFNRKPRLIFYRRTSLSCAPVCIHLNKLDRSKQWFQLVGLVSRAAKLAIHSLNQS